MINQEIIIFDGQKLAHSREEALKNEVSALSAQNKSIKIAAILFTEDVGSRLYSSLKKEAALRSGIEYELSIFSMNDPISEIVQKITSLNQDKTVTGIIIQKPWRKTWIEVTSVDTKSKTKEDFNTWWYTLVQTIKISKDVDGLHPETLQSIQQGTWQEEGKVLPATCKAVVSILAEAGWNCIPPKKTDTLEENTNNIMHNNKDTKVIILGTSDLLGKPLYYLLKNAQYDVENIGTKGLNDRIEAGTALKDADIIVSATGRRHLITGDMVKEGVVIVDVGEPQPDVDFNSVAQKAAFITPVPGGVGPMTVVSLLENGVSMTY